MPAALAFHSSQSSAVETPSPEQPGAGADAPPQLFPSSLQRSTSSLAGSRKADTIRTDRRTVQRQTRSLTLALTAFSFRGLAPAGNGNTINSALHVSQI